MKHKFVTLFVFFALIFGAWVSVVGASTDCAFSTVGTTMTLLGNCTTDSTIYVPDGFTLDGAGYTITAIDPIGGHFKGAVIKNAGATAHVTNLTITGMFASVCDAGDDRLVGIWFEGASGSITHNTVVNFYQIASGCQEGNSIQARNLPFDGTHPNTKTVEISHNVVNAFMKTGIVANGDLNVSIHHNQVGASANQYNLAANSIQVAYGAMGEVRSNQIAGNQWFGPSDYAATAILVYLADVDVSKNKISGNADIGIYLYGDNCTADNNHIFDEGVDGGHYDIGLGNWGEGNVITNNKVGGYDVPYDNVTGGKNKAHPEE